MIRPFTLLTAALAVGSGFYLFQAKHRTKLLDERIAAVEEETASAQTRISVLRAEWALENSPSRLADLAARYLELAPMQPSQAVSLSDLSSHLPPPAEPGAVPAIAQSDLAVLAALLQPGLYASLDYFAPANTEAQPPPAPVFVAAAPAASSPQAPANHEAVAPAQPSNVAAVSPPAAPEPAPAPAQPPLRAVRPALIATAAPAPLARPRARPVPVLTSALGGAYPDLPPPAPLSGSH